ESHAGSVSGPSRSAPRARRRSRKSPVRALRRSTVAERNWAQPAATAQLAGCAADHDAERGRMNVVAVSTPSYSEWRVPIGTLPSTEGAVADGVKRMRACNDRDVGNMPPRSLREHPYLRNG